MTNMEIEHGHDILTPADDAFVFETAARMRDPHLFAQGLGDRCLFDSHECLLHTPGLHYVYLRGISLDRPLQSKARNHHETEHRKKEDDRMDQETRRCCDPSLGDIHESTQHHLGDLVRLGIRHEEEHQSRNEGVLCLQHQIQHPLTLMAGNY